MDNITKMQSDIANLTSTLNAILNNAKQTNEFGTIIAPITDGDYVRIDRDGQSYKIKLNEIGTGETVPTNVGFSDLTGVPSDNPDLNAALSSKENLLGNPALDGYILSSLANGTRVWIPFTLPNVSVETVNNQAPDGNGNVTINYQNVGALSDTTTTITQAQANSIANNDAHRVSPYVHVTYDQSAGLDASNNVSAANPVATMADVGGDGDMLKSTYDTNNSGIVDNAEKVNGLTVETAVPSGALFTDTIYDDADIQAEVDLNTAKETNIPHPLVETAVPSDAVFTDTQVDIQAGTNITIDKTNPLQPVINSDNTTYTDAEIKTKYEANADTNAFTDAEETKLNLLEQGITRNRVAPVVNLGILDIDFDSKNEIKTTAPVEINGNINVNVINISNADTALIELYITNTVIITMPNNSLMQNTELRWNSITKELTIEGGIGSTLELSLSIVDGENKFILSDNFI